MSKGSHIARMVLTTSSELGVNHGLWSISLKMRVIQVWKYSDQDTFGKVSADQWIERRTRSFDEEFLNMSSYSWS